MIKKMLYYSLVLGIAGIVYVAYDTKIQLYTRDINNLLYSIGPKEYPTSGGTEEEYATIQKTESIVPIGISLEEVRQIDDSIWEHIPDDKLKEYCKNRVDYLSATSHKLQTAADKAVYCIEEAVLLEEQIETLQHTNLVQSDVIALYDKKSKSLYGQVPGMALSALIGQIVAMLFIVPFKLYKGIKNKPDLTSA